jgi:hypothetical protein
MGVKRPEHEAYHSPEVKNGGAITPLPHTSGMNSGNLNKREEKDEEIQYQQI